MAMICDECHLNPATVHVTRIVNGKKIVRHLCAGCAEKLGFTTNEFGFPGFFEIPDIFASLFKRRQADRIYDYFSESAQKVIHLANEEAKRLSHDHLTAEHLLLGLIKEEGSAYKVLEALGVKIVDIFSDIESLIGHGDKQPKEITLSPRAKKVLELAYNAAREMGFNYVGSEHILLGIIREGESIAAQSLHKRKVTFEKAAKQILSESEKAQTPPDDVPSEFEEEEMFGFPGFQLGGGMPGTAVAQPPRKAALSQFGRDLTLDAKEGRLDPVIDREKEVDRVIRILSRRTKNNPALLGDPGVGKTAIVEGLAQRIINGDVPEILKGKQLIALDLGGMVAGTKYRGEFESRVKKVLDEIIAKKRQIILFIDELHTLVGAGAAEGAIDAANMLKPALARGELQVIGATTIEEYRKYIEKDAALERRFQPVMINEPTKELAIEILKGIRDRYEEHHRVKIPDAAIEAAVNLSDRYISDRFLPDKAIDVMDEAAAKVRLRLISPPRELKEAQRALEQVKKEKEEATSNQKYEKAAKLRDQIKESENKVKEMEDKWKLERGKGDSLSVVKEDDIAEVVSDWTGIPVVKLTAAEMEKLLKMEETLHKRVIGQEEAIDAIAQAIRRGRAGLKMPERPVGSFIFAGPTGVGKTEVAKRLAEFMFGTIEAMIRIDMSEYMEKHTISRLIGAPPGYVGYEEGGTLTEAVRRKPYSVILFDEVEKAHPDVFNILLQVLEDGRLTDSKGHVVDFKNTVLILTTNVGQRMIIQQGAIGFMAKSDREATYEQMKNTVLDEMKKEFRPELLNRVDEIIVFHTLTDEELKKIAALMILDVQKQMENQDMKIICGDDVQSLIVKEGYDPKFGARPLRRAVQRFIENPLSNEIIQGKFKAGDEVSAKIVDGKMVFEKTGKVEIKNKKSADISKETVAVKKGTETKEVGGEEREKRGRKKAR
ncbi:MAG: ATP-dependent Clp protease ATP-binding subunit ClpC [Candidatus Saganbacteria bacterium]|uniref:ATP-dependent Clp protease ATP-binding subunit ClpC n=1 Tax=Candidatus Saganbacteria bacterium TaxID=2575572 RepID=A0A833L1C8_UNCSA|nr:MAG: ATP-dependent Clp protease ATP-binding subunit ClpC [Candidatus Saganbacteria bacterium]